MKTTTEAHNRKRFTTIWNELRSSQKRSRTAPPYSKYFNRPLGRIFAVVAFQLGMSPNQVTYVSAAFTFGGILVLALAPATVATGIIVAVTLVLGYALDSSDGQVARLQGKSSAVGEWLDHMIDSVKISSIHLAVLCTFYWHFELSHPALLLVPIVFTIVQTVHFFGMILVDLLVREHTAGRAAGQHTSGASPVDPATRTARLTTWAKLPIDYGFLCIAFLLLGAHTLFVAIYTTLAIAWLGYLLLVVRKWQRDVAALD